jgi:hypothetical protein
MFSLSPSTIALAWQNLVNNGGVSNKFFGFLQLISVIDTHVTEKIVAEKQYTFKGANLSNSVESLFTFKGEKRYKNEDIYHVAFSKNWYNLLLEEFLENQQPNILDVVIISFQNRQFPKVLS